jgi:hypothetical protein
MVRLDGGDVMTNAEWQQSTDTLAMLHYCQDVLDKSTLNFIIKRWLSQRRQRRLFCALARHEWEKLGGDEQRIVTLAEQYLDSKSRQASMLFGYHPVVEPGSLVRWVSDSSLHSPILRWTIRTSKDRLRNPEFATIVRDIFGPHPPDNLYRPEVCVWCGGYGWCGSLENRFDRINCSACSERGYVLPAWRTPLIQDMAQATFLFRTATGSLDSARMHVLADALMDAGCPESQHQECPECAGSGKLLRNAPKDSIEFYVGIQQVWVGCWRCAGDYDGGRCGRGWVSVPHPILAHLQSPQVHYPGCWAVDMLRSGISHDDTT